MFKTRLLATIAGALVSIGALAATVNVSWTHPTQYTDDAALNAADIEHTRVEYGTCTGTAAPYTFGTKAGEFLAVRLAPTDLEPPTSATLSVPGWGRKCYRAYTKMLAAAGGETSGTSAVVTKVTPSPVPKPPGFVTSGVTLVFTVKALDDGRLVLNKNVGTVPDGTACSDWTVLRQGGEQYHRVDRSDVDFTRLTAATRLVASCEAAA